MNGIAEIDKSGRLVVPKNVRDALRVRAGERFHVETRGDEIVLRREEQPSLVERDGLWVLSSGMQTNYDIVQLIEDDRNRRMLYVSGLSDEP